MYLRPTRRHSTPENTSRFPFHSARSCCDCTHVAVHISPCVSIVEPVCSPCIRCCVRFPCVLCSLQVPMCTRPFGSLPTLRLCSRPHLSCVFTVFPFILSVPTLRVPSHRARALPSDQGCLFFAFPWFMSAPQARVHSYSTQHLR